MVQIYKDTVQLAALLSVSEADTLQLGHMPA